MGDPELDRWLQEAIGPLSERSKGQPKARAAREMRQLVAQLPKHFKALPVALDLRRIERAQAFFRSSSIRLGISLLGLSLPSLYANARGAATLMSTGRMYHQYAERAEETLSFIIDLMTPGAFEAEGLAIKRTLEVRLKHAFVRHAIQHKGSTHNMPINQAELLGTLLAFSTRALDGLSLLGSHVTPEEDADWFYLWQTVGGLVGIHPLAMPSTPAEARSLWPQLDESANTQSPASELLGQAHEQFLRKHFLPAPLPAVLIHYFLGSQTAENALGVKRPRSSALWITGLKVALLSFEAAGRLRRPEQREATEQALLQELRIAWREQRPLNALTLLPRAWRVAV